MLIHADKNKKKIRVNPPNPLNPRSISARVTPAYKLRAAKMPPVNMGVYKYYGYMYNQGIAGRARNDVRGGDCGSRRGGYARNDLGDVIAQAASLADHSILLFK